MNYLGVTITEEERKELERAFNRREEYKNPYEHYGFHTGYGMEEKEIYVRGGKEVL